MFAILSHSFTATAFQFARILEYVFAFFSFRLRPISSVTANTSSAISTSSASGNVTGTSERVGGLIGDNSSTITSSFAIGSVLGKNSSNVYQNYVGGLVGFNNNSNISGSYHTTGTVQGLDNVGGLVGKNQGTSSLTYTIDTSYSSGSVSGGNYVGGLVGYSYYNSSITNSYVANGSSVTGTKNVGGLVGMSDTTSQSTYPASVTNSYYNVNIDIEIIEDFIYNYIQSRNPSRDKPVFEPYNHKIIKRVYQNQYSRFRKR